MYSPFISVHHALIAFAMLWAADTASSQTLDWGSLTQSTIVDSQGDPLNTTFLFQLGTFDVGFTPTQSNLGEWATNWRVFDSASYSYDPASLGYFTATEDVQDVTGYASIFQGLQAYLWIRNSADTEYFLANAGSWTFPLLDSECCPTGAVTQWSVSDLGTDDPIWGSQLDNHGGGTYDGSGGPYDLQTHVVPETSSSLFVLLGGSLALVRRRRRVV